MTPLDILGLVGSREICDRAGIKALSTLHRIIQRGDGPTPYSVAKNGVMFREAEVEEFLARYRRWERRAKKRSRMARAPEI